MLQLFVTGPPGAGKTTVSKLLCDEFRLELVATGELLRENMTAQTPLGREAQRCIAAKTLIPDTVVVDMVASKIDSSEQRKRGWVLDGFPRTPDQCRTLQRDKRISPTVAIVLELSERECAKRIAGRRFDPTTGLIYHREFRLSKDRDVNARLVARADDAPDKLSPRFEAYRTFGEQTNALLAPVVHCVDASGSPEEVLDKISTLLLSLAQGNNGGNAERVPSHLERFDALHASNQPQTSQTPSVATAGVSFGKAAQFKKQMPQRIEEECEDEIDEDDHVHVGMGESAMNPLSNTIQHECSFDYSYDDDQANAQQGKAFQRRPASASVDSPAVNAYSPAPTEIIVTPPASNNDEELLDVTSALCPIAAASPPTEDELSMERFRNMLLDGFDVLKHGRRGSPHTRTVFADVEFKRIFWQKPAKDKRSKKARLDQSILLADVVQVVRGMKTDVLKRSGDVAKYERYLSLVSDDRTLDLELATEADSEFLRRGFERLLLQHSDGRGGL